MKKGKRCILLILIMLLIQGCRYQQFDLSSTKKQTIEHPTREVREGLEIKIADNLYSSYGYMRVHYIDVGQGDCTFIELGNGQTMLIDAGNPHNREEIVSFIKDLQYSDIDYVVATNSQEDCIGGMTHVLQSFPVRKIYVPDTEHTSDAYENMLEVIDEKDIELNAAKKGVSILNSGMIEIDILAPINEEYSESNNFSAVVRLIYGETSFLFMGDADKHVENELSDAGIDVDVLRLGQHGANSASSESFIDAVSPQYAIISCGKEGQPDSEVLALLKEKNIQFYRTDEDGTIAVTADNKKNITVEE